MSSSPNGASNSSVLAELDAIADRARGEIERLEQQREVIDATLKRLRRVVAAAAEQPAKPSPRKPAGKSRGVARPTLLKVAEHVASLDSSATFTVLDVAQSLSISDPTVYMAFNELRDIELLGKAGQAEPTRKGAKGRALYRVLDAHALDRLREPANA